MMLFTYFILFYYGEGLSIAVLLKKLDLIFGPNKQQLFTECKLDRLKICHSTHSFVGIIGVFLSMQMLTKLTKYG